MVRPNTRWYDEPAARFHEFPILILSSAESIMADASSQEMIDNLRHSVRRWKTLSLTLLATLGLAIGFACGTAVAQLQHVMAAREAELEARRQAEQQVQAGPRDTDRATELAHERLQLARQAVDVLITRAAEDWKTK